MRQIAVIQVWLRDPFSNSRSEYKELLNNNRIDKSLLSRGFIPKIPTCATIALAACVVFRVPETFGTFSSRRAWNAATRRKGVKWKLNCCQTRLKLRDICLKCLQRGFHSCEGGNGSVFIQCDDTRGDMSEGKAWHYYARYVQPEEPMKV